jgi:hypothetical protein
MPLSGRRKAPKRSLDLLFCLARDGKRYLLLRSRGVNSFSILQSQLGEMEENRTQC